MSTTKLTVTLPHDPLTPLDPHDCPNPASLRLLRRELYGNAQAVTSDLGGGTHGHLGMLMPHTEYMKLSGVAYVTPTKPEIPNYTNVPEEQRRAYRDWYIEQGQAYNEYRALESHLKSLVIAAVPDIYICELQDVQVGYANVTIPAMLNHLFNDHGKIEPKHLEANLEQINTPWNPDEQIQTVFNNGNICRQFAEEGGDKITDSAYIRILVKIFRKSGVLTKAVTDWEEKDETEHTVENAIKHFKRANIVRLTNDAATKDILSANQAVQAPTHPANTTTSQKPSEIKGWSYCWTHGLGPGKHSSTNCQHPKEGHQKEATLSNRLGGSNIIREPGPRRPYNKKRKPTGQLSTPIAAHT